MREASACVAGEDSYSRSVTRTLARWAATGGRGGGVGKRDGTKSSDDRSACGEKGAGGRGGRMDGETAWPAQNGA